ncbi:hypothetical protein BH10BAC3_BH10BAC3_32380 [soil metagenome]
MASSKKITSEQAMQDLAARKHHVDQTTAAAMVKKFKGFRTKLASAKKNGGELPANAPDLPTFITYNKKAIQNLLKKPECAGLRIYPAINADNFLTLVLVGVDEAGENILDNTLLASSAKSSAKTVTTTVVDEGQMSPPYPAPKTGI